MLPGHATSRAHLALLPALFDGQGTQPGWHGIVLFEKLKQGIGRIEPSNDHDDQCLQDQAVRILLGRP